MSFRGRNLQCFLVRKLESLTKCLKQMLLVANLVKENLIALVGAPLRMKARQVGVSLL